MLLYKTKADCMIWRVCKHLLPVGQKTAAVGTMIPVEQSGRGQEVQALAFSCASIWRGSRTPAQI